MKKLKFFFLIGLGLILKSCSYYVYPESVMSYASSMPAETPNPGWYTRTGTLVLGQKTYPNALIWQDMSIERNGLMVTVKKSGQRTLYFDLRNPELEFEHSFKALSKTNKPIEVYVVIYGAGRSNYVIVNDGKNKEYYYLRRN